MLVVNSGILPVLNSWELNSYIQKCIISPPSSFSFFNCSDQPSIQLDNFFVSRNNLVEIILSESERYFVVDWKYVGGALWFEKALIYKV